MISRLIGLPGYEVDPEKIGLKPVDPRSFLNELAHALTQRGKREQITTYGRQFMSKGYYLRYMKHPDGDYYELQTGLKGPGESMSLPKGWINDQLPKRLNMPDLALADLVGHRMAVLFARGSEGAIGDPRLMTVVTSEIEALLDSSVPLQPTPSEISPFGERRHDWF